MELTDYDHFIIYFSGGKDSTACFLHLLELGVPRDKIELWHHDVDGGRPFMDWPITPDYCRKFADAFGVPLYMSYKEGGFHREMNRENEPTAPIWFQDENWQWHVTGGKGKPNTRKKFPQVSADLNVRWCSAYLKIDVGAAALRNQSRFKNKKVLTISGERAEESKARAGYNEFEVDRADLRNGKKPRHVDRWRPIKEWTKWDVWDKMKEYGVNPHPAYWLGYGRVSCKKCIFGGKNEFATARDIDPEGFDELVEHENEFGVTLKRDTDLVTLADKGEVLNAARTDEHNRQLSMQHEYTDRILVDHWEYPPGVHGDNCGPS
jgi:3'-phosphoadenosine 5'-phosphosulfate sulfotransferase (PAPS reductase)/FAD synthetase